MADTFVGMIIFDHKLLQFTLLGLVFCLHGSCEDVSLLQVSTVSVSIEKTRIVDFEVK